MSTLRAVVRGWDWTLFMAAAALSLMGGLAMASAASTLNPSLAIRHAGWILAGMVVACGVATTNYRRWSEGVEVVYALSVAALALVLLAGATRLGATRWLSVLGVSVQPSELAKLTTVWLLARYVGGRSAPLGMRDLIISAAFVIPPLLLIFIQPDLGSASILGAVWFGVVWVAGMPQRVLLGLGGGVLALLPLGWHLLRDYQRDRLLAFINPHADPLGVGFSVIQSTIAIGSGRLWGRGWFAGTQSQLNFLPERHSDFIFSVIGEEWGLLGCLAVLAGFWVLLSRILRIAQKTSDPQGQLLAIGIFSWLAYQAVVNMGMVMGLLPVVGVPLPLISYGGSSMVTVWVALGLLQSVHRTDRV